MRSGTAKSEMTPSLSGRTATMLAGVRPTIRFASAPTARILFVVRSMGNDRGLVDDDAAALDGDERIRRSQIDAEIVRKESTQSRECVRHTGSIAPDDSGRS